MIEIKQHSWTKNGDNYHSPFFVFVDGTPDFRLSDCCMCKFYLGQGSDCKKIQEIGSAGDDMIYPFCGKICGYWERKAV